MLDKKRLIERLSDNTLRATLHGYYSASLACDEGKEIFLLTVDGKPVHKVIQALFEELDLKENDLLRLSVSVRKTRWKRKKKSKDAVIKPQARSRAQLLEWLCSTWVASYIGPADGYIFLKHIMVKPSVIFQVVLSGNTLTDGVWRLLKFDLFDERQPDGTYQPVMVMRDDDLLDLATSNNPSILKRQLIAHGFLSEEEFDIFFQPNQVKQEALAKTLPKLVIRTPK